MNLALSLFAVYLLIIGLAAAFYSDSFKKIVSLGILYFASSLTGQILAAPLLLISVAMFLIEVTGATPSPAIVVPSGLAALLFCLTLRNAYKGTLDLNAVLPGSNKPGVQDLLIGALLPFKTSHPDVKRIADIAYGEAGVKNRLDLYVPQTMSSDPMPVMIHIHGGAWSIGHKKQQGLPLINNMVSKGWLAVDINYRLGPKHRFPTLFEDVMRAIAWVKTNIADYGGDPDFVVLTGGSAGGHLTALSALMPNNDDFKSGFEDVDCSVQAAVPVYGLYDFLDRTGALKDLGQKGFEKFMTRVTMPGPRETHEAFWDTVSPISHVRADAPPFLVIHGRGDALAPFQGAELFVEALSKVSQQDVIFAPLTRGQHAYDIAGAPPTPAHVRLVERFLTQAHAAHKSKN